MTSTTRKKRNKMKVWAVAVWLVIWQLVSMWIGQEILLVSPAAVFRRLLELIPTGEFWSSVLFSVVRITGGFLLAAVAGVTAAGLAVKFRRVEEFLHPFVLTVKAIPVASFVILVLIWVPSRNLSVVISFLMVFPILYTNVLAAEVIGIPDNSIGEQLYNAKVYLNTPDLFAWTVVIVALSFVFERLFLYFIDCTVKRLERMK